MREGLNKMLNISDKIRNINSEYLEDEIILEYGLLSLMLYEPTMYMNLIDEINIERDKYIGTSDRMQFILLYKKVFLAQKRKLKKLLDNIENRTIRITPEPTKDEFIRFLKDRWEYNYEVSNFENVCCYASACIRRAIHTTDEELYLLRYYPFVYYNHPSSYIGGEFNYRYENEVLIYNKVNALTDGMHHFRLHVTDETSLSEKRSMLNVFAFLNGCPNFEFINNTHVNQKLDELYQRFDLLDCIRLRHPQYLKSDVNKPIYLELPILKNRNGYKIVVFKKMPHEGILDLYHASLKQFEPLPRCVFLYRVFEYAAANHYKRVINPPDYHPEDALEYYYNLALQYNPNPLYYVDFGNERRKTKVCNLFSVLKAEAKKIVIEWSTAPFLRNKSIGEIIYLTGRNFTAHGASGQNGERNMQYDYDKNYLHINNINILLELIARYVIELLNPELKNVVERKVSCYDEKYR